MKTSAERLLLLGFIASAVALGGMGWLSYRTTTNLIAAERQVAHTQEVIATLESGLAILADAESKQRGFLLTGDPQFLRDCQNTQGRVSGWVDSLRKLTADNPEQQQRLNRLEPLIAQRLAFLNNRIQIRLQQGLSATVRAVALHEGEALMDQIWQDTMEMRTTEEQLLSQREQAAANKAQRGVLIILACSALAGIVGLVAVRVILHDLKLRREAEAERNRFFEVSRDLICVAGFDGYFKLLNPAWEEKLGYTRQELKARPFVEFVHPEDRPVTADVTANLATGEEVVRFENRYVCRDGSCRWLAWSARPAVPQRLIYATARDVTEQKANEEKIIRLNHDLQSHTRQLETANQELESFSYSVSHDLRAPLRHIDGFVKLLDKQAGEKLDERGRRYLNIIADSARQMGVLIDDLLAFSRMSRTQMRCAKVALDSLVQEAVEQARTEAAERRINWKIGPLPEVEADAAMLRQVWINLIANAVKYSRPRDPAEIEIGCNADNGEIVLYVRDNGVGFDMQYVDKLFGVFQRLHRSDEFEGTGIGLANVRRIIARHGGRTWAEGRLDAGATFYFSLPKKPFETKGQNGSVETHPAG